MAAIAVIGNCQAAPIARLVAALSPGVRIVLVTQVHQTSLSDEPLIHQACERADLIFAQIIGPNFGLPFVRTSALESLWPNKTITWSNIHFRGQCPDLFNATARGLRLTGPMNAYHLKTALTAWRSGMNAKDATTALHDGDGNGEWAQIGASALIELRRRESAAVVQAADLIEQDWHDRPLFWTFNHPRVTLLKSLALRLIKAAGLPASGTVPTTMGEPLGVIRPPLTPGMRAALSLRWPHEGPAETPGLPGGAPRRSWPLPQLVEGFFRAYDGNPEAARAATLS